MKKFKTVASVSINLENTPTIEEIISQALQTAKYAYYPKDKAIKLINNEIKESGLFKSTSRAVEKPNKEPKRIGSKRSNNKQSKHSNTNTTKTP